MLESKFLKENIQNVEKLMSIPLLKKFEIEHLNNLLRISKIKQYKDGEAIIAEGNTDPWLFFLLSGQVRIVKNGEELTRIRRRGDVFGEMGLLKTDSQKLASAYAVGETTCLSTDSSHIEQLSDKDKMAFCYILYRILAKVVTDRLHATNEELVKAKKQLAYYESRIEPIEIKE